MNKLIIRLFAFVLTAWLATLSTIAAPRVQHVFIISIDGGKPAVIAAKQHARPQAAGRRGRSTWVADTIYPSITLPSHTSMLTGVGPGQT